MICAESGLHVGTGHVMRCLAIAQAWVRSGGTSTFVIRAGLAGIEQRILAAGCSLELLPESQTTSPEMFVQEVLRGRPSLAILDGYIFSAEEQQTVTDAGVQVLAVDDYCHASSYPVRWVLNQNPYATAEMYPLKNPDTQLLLGTAYAVLRNDFFSWLGWTRFNPSRARKILITMGGTDPANASSKILRGLSLLNMDGIEITLVVGSGNPHFQLLRSELARSRLPVTLAQDVQNMPALMAWADMAIAAAGITSYELCYMGLPSVLLVVAENQRRIAERLSDLQMAVNAGSLEKFDLESFARCVQALIDSQTHRQEMSERARKLIDGQGSERVRAALQHRQLNLRPARQEDCRLLFEWATDPAVRTMSFHPETISWEEHCSWFSDRLEDDATVIYIGENSLGQPVGLVRFHLKGRCALLSINVASQFRGLGWGKELIYFSTRSLVRETQVESIEALVKPANENSIRLFETSGFSQAKTTQTSTEDVLLFTWNCPRAHDAN